MGTMRRQRTAGEVIPETTSQEFDFATDAEAHAFIEGFQLLNVEVDLIEGFGLTERADGKWLVTVHWHQRNLSA